MLHLPRWHVAQPPHSEGTSPGGGSDLGTSATFGLSYAETLAHWRKRFLDAWPQISEQGFDQRFRRLWEYYLCYCEAGFRTGAIDVGIYRFRRPV